MIDQRTEPSPKALEAALVAVLLMIAASPSLAAGPKAQDTESFPLLLWCLTLIFSVAGGLLAVVHGMRRNSRVVFLRGLGGVIAGYLLSLIAGALIAPIAPLNMSNVVPWGIFWTMFSGVPVLAIAVATTAIAALAGTVIRRGRTQRGLGSTGVPKTTSPRSARDKALVVLYWVLGTTLAALAGWLYWPWFYCGEPTHGRVVDAETKQPLEGVVIVAQWIPFGGHGGPSLHVAEVVTGSNGEYLIPGWGPVFRPYRNDLDYSLDDPSLLVFKGGYSPLGLSNNGFGRARRSDWNNRTIELKAFTGTPEQRLDQLDLLLRNVGPVSGLAQRMYREMAKEEASIPPSTRRGQAKSLFARVHADLHEEPAK